MCRLALCEQLTMLHCNAILPSHRDSAGSLGLACGSCSPLAELGVVPGPVTPAAAFLVQPVDQGGGACDGVADGALPNAAESRRWIDAGAVAGREDISTSIGLDSVLKWGGWRSPVPISWS